MKVQATITLGKRKSILHDIEITDKNLKTYFYGAIEDAVIRMLDKLQSTLITELRKAIEEEIPHESDKDSERRETVRKPNHST